MDDSDLVAITLNGLGKEYKKFDTSIVVRGVFSTTISPHTFDPIPILLFCICLESNELFKSFTLLFEKVYPHKPCVIINECDVVPVSNGLWLMLPSFGNENIACFPS